MKQKRKIKKQLSNSNSDSSTLSINGSFEDVIRVSVGKEPTRHNLSENKEEEKPVQKKKKSN